MHGAFEKLAILPDVPTMCIHHPQDRAAALARGRDDAFLRRHQGLVTRQHHRTTGFAELVEHIHYNDRRRGGVNANRVLDLLGGKQIYSHKARPRALSAPVWIIRSVQFIVKSEETKRTGAR